jgi:hypothetical protein
LRIPAFLQKYFSEEKALEQLPHKRLEKEELEAERVRLPDEETELQKNLRQIARLDSMLLKREAAGTAQLQSAMVELEAARASLAKEAAQTKAEKNRHSAEDQGPRERSQLRIVQAPSKFTEQQRNALCHPSSLGQL